MRSKKTGTTKEPAAQSKSRRQQEIERLVKERRQLRKQWKKATDAEKAGLEALQNGIKQRLATLRRAECLRKQHKKKEQAKAHVLQRSIQVCQKPLYQGENRNPKSTCEGTGGVPEKHLL